MGYFRGTMNGAVRFGGRRKGEGAQGIMGKGGQLTSGPPHRSVGSEIGTCCQ